MVKAIKNTPKSKCIYCGEEIDPGISNEISHLEICSKAPKVVYSGEITIRQIDEGFKELEEDYRKNRLKS